MKTKADLIELLTTPPKKNAQPAFDTKASAEKAITAVLDGMTEILSSKDADGLTIVGFGSFRKVKRNARTGRNPATGESIKIKASKTVTFKISKKLKDSLK